MPQPAAESFGLGFDGGSSRTARRARCRAIAEPSEPVESGMKLKALVCTRPTSGFEIGKRWR